MFGIILCVFLHCDPLKKATDMRYYLMRSERKSDAAFLSRKQACEHYILYYLARSEEPCEHYLVYYLARSEGQFLILFSQKNNLVNIILCII
jgi:hypothetical protein